MNHSGPERNEDWLEVILGLDLGAELLKRLQALLQAPPPRFGSGLTINYINDCPHWGAPIADY